MDTINILLSTDNKYVMPTGVLMHSIGMHNDSVKYFILINRDFKTENKNKLTKIASSYHSEISYYIISDDVTVELPFGRDNMPKHVTKATYYRLFITQVLPSDIHKIIYLDGDMIVRKSLKSLFEINLDEFALGAVHDMDEPINMKRLYEYVGDGYFNAGMLLVNLDYWREYNCYKLFIQFIQEHGDKILMHDQDVLNCVFRKNVKWLPLTYNFQSGFILSVSNRRYNVELQMEIDDCKTDPAIIHYTVYHKPWHISCFHPYRKLWRNYLSKSEWAGYHFEEDKPKKLIHYIRNVLLRHNLWIPKYNRTEYEKLPNLEF